MAKQSTYSFYLKLIRLIVLLFINNANYGYTLKVDGFTELTVFAGSKARLTCNATQWSDDVSLIIWYRGITGKPLSSLDTRRPSPTSSKASSILTSSSTSSSSSSSSPSLSLSTSVSSTSPNSDGHSPDPTKYYFDATSDPSVFIIDHLTESDSGDYRCRIDYRLSRTRNYVVRLNVIVLPEEVIITDYKGLRVNQVIGPVDEGTDLVLYCDAFGKPEPSVSWWMSDYTLLDDTYYKSPRGSMRNELTLNSLNRSILMKEIICRASNTNLTRPKEESIFIDLNLRPLEVFLVPPDKQLSANKQVAFECRTIGSRPRPFISWWLDGDKVTPLSETTNGDTNVTINTAIFIFKSYNNGKFFSCRAENPNLDESSIDEGMILNIVYVPLLKLTLGPNIKGENIREGFDVYLECIINANPRVFETSWMFEGKPLISDPSKRIIISNQSLVLQNISKHSRGRYQCVGRNEEGLGTSNPLYLRVQYIPVCSGKHATKSPMAIARNERARIVCEVDSDPDDVTFRWYLNNSSETIEIKSFTTNGTQSILSYSPRTRLSYGSLLCLAENSIGKQKEPCIFHIIPAGPPQPPANCFLSNQSMTSILVNCEPGDDGGLQQYFTMEVIEANSQNSLINLTSKDRPTFLVDRLPPGSSIRFNIYASNIKGKSAAISILGSTLGPPEKQTSSTSTIADNEPVDWLIWLIAIVLITLMITILILIGLRLIGNKGPNQNQGFVSIDYEAHPIRQEDVKSSPQMISASFKGQETCDGYPTSTSIVYKLNTSSLHTTVDDIRYETGIETSDYPATMFLETTLFEGSIDEASMEKQFIPFGKINLTQTQSNGPDECSQISTNDYSLRHIYQFTDNTIKDIPL
ncbi:hemicentin-1 isoform X2 [Tetranychus urticae]|uniref:hemicentin-1 isoform X2 n=1 Tax=Tetranychus urticae TaxID=32264 RepID=UPI00077BF795|nr:hemicentin-1 isoform X2 [Tetranychus urticae]